MSTLEAIARDEVEPAAGKAVITRCVAEGEQAGTIYSVLARWVWVALTGRRFDEDLRSWHRVLRDASAMVEQGLADRQPDAKRYAEQIDALSDLVRISIEMGEGVTRRDVATRTHVGDLLELLAGSQGESVDRKTIAEALKLREANLSRVLTLLVASGLIEREPQGRKASFRITATGMEALQQSKGDELAKLREQYAMMMREIAEAKRALATAEPEWSMLRRDAAGARLAEQNDVEMAALAAFREQSWNAMLRAVVEEVAGRVSNASFPLAYVGQLAPPRKLPAGTMDEYTMCRTLEIKEESAAPPRHLFSIVPSHSDAGLEPMAMRMVALDQTRSLIPGRSFDDRQNQVSTAKGRRPVASTGGMRDRG